MSYPENDPKVNLKANPLPSTVVNPAPIRVPNPIPNPAATVTPSPAPFRHALGGIKETTVAASTVPAVDFKAVLSDLPGNPFIYQRRVAQTILPANPNVVVTQNLVNTISGKPLTTNVADQIKDVSTEGGSQ
jgi:hypothetical protein